MKRLQTNHPTVNIVSHENVSTVISKLTFLKICSSKMSSKKLRSIFEQTVTNGQYLLKKCQGAFSKAKSRQDFQLVFRK